MTASQGPDDLDYLAAGRGRRILVVALSVVAVVLVGGLLLSAVVGDWKDRPIRSFNVNEDGDVRVEGHCNDAGRVTVVDESSDEVVLRLQVRGNHLGDCLACPMADLDDPLGDRQVVDATTGSTIRRDASACPSTP